MRSLFILILFSSTGIFAFADLVIPKSSATPTPAVNKATSGQIHQIDQEIQARKLQVFHYKKSNDPMSRLQIKNLEAEIETLQQQKVDLQKLPAK